MRFMPKEIIDRIEQRINYTFRNEYLIKLMSNYTRTRKQKHTTNEGLLQSCKLEKLGDIFLQQVQKRYNLPEFVNDNYFLGLIALQLEIGTEHEFRVGKVLGSRVEVLIAIIWEDSKDLATVYHSTLRLLCPLL